VEWCGIYHFGDNGSWLHAAAGSRWWTSDDECVGGGAMWQCGDVDVILGEGYTLMSVLEVGS
jgi:hypothetical protein